MTNYMDIDFSTFEEMTTALHKMAVGTEMAWVGLEFIFNIIQKAQPKIIVELGVAEGGTTRFLLHLLNQIKETKLYSFDYRTSCFSDQNNKIGFCAFDYYKIIKNDVTWNLFTGGMPCKFFEHVLEPVDVCIIDTAHSNPGEYLNILEILPLMRKNGIIIMHDVALHLKHHHAYTARVAMNTLKGKRLYVENKKGNDFGIIANIEGVILADRLEEMAIPLFLNLTLPWGYDISRVDYNTVYNWFSQHYTKQCIDIFEFSYNFYLNKKIEALRDKIKGKIK